MPESNELVLVDKYDMPRDENIMWAKRMLVDLIWKEANLEGIAVTFLETQTIIDGMSVAGLTIMQVKAINNLKHAWQFVLDNLGVVIDIQYLRQLNAIIGAEGVVMQAGVIRYTDVKMGGTDWAPALPEPEEISSTLGQLAQHEPPTDQAIELFCAICKGQWFYDGNKRTAQLAANAVLIDKGRGVLAVPQNRLTEFAEKLIAYYETGAKAPLKEELFTHAIDGNEQARASR